MLDENDDIFPTCPLKNVKKEKNCLGGLIFF